MKVSLVTAISAALGVAAAGCSFSGSSTAGPASLMRTPIRVSHVGASTSVNWPDFGFIIAGGRYNRHEATLSPQSVHGLKKLWSAPLGCNGSICGGSSAALINGVIYVGSYDGSVYALNAATGATLWSFPTGGEAFSTPAVVNGVVYVGSNDRNVYALNAATGAELWSYTTGYDVTSSPAVSKDVVYIGSEDGSIYALKASDGTKLWSFATRLTVDSSPAVANGVVYIGAADDHLYALNAAAGTKLWSYTAGDEVNSSPAVANGIVYFGSQDSNVYAVSGPAPEPSSGRSRPVTT